MSVQGGSGRSACLVGGHLAGWAGLVCQGGRLAKFPFFLPERNWNAVKAIWLEMVGLRFEDTAGKTILLPGHVYLWEFVVATATLFGRCLSAYCFHGLSPLDRRDVSQWVNFGGGPWP